MNKIRIKIPKAEFENLYLNQNLSSAEIASKFGCGKTLVLKRLNSFMIPLRKSGAKRKVLIDREILSDLYINKRMSMNKIAEMYDTDTPIILNRIREYNIKPRTISETLRGRVPWNKGKSPSEKTLKKLSRISKKRWENQEFRKKMEIRDKIASKRMTEDGNPMKNKNISERVRKKLIGLFTGDKNPAKRLSVRKKISKILKGHKIAVETREKIRNNLIGRFGGEKNPFFGKHHTKEVRRKSRLRAIRQLISGSFRNKTTSIELKIGKELTKRNIFYKKQFPLLKMTVADFYLPQNKIVIYADGEFWHKSKWAERQGTIEKDKKQNKILSNIGYKVFRFSEADINYSVSSCVDKVVNYINSIKI